MNKTVIYIFGGFIILLIITYMKRNKIVSAVFNDQLTPNFKLGELLTTSQPFPNIPNEEEKKNLKSLAVNVLQPVRDLLGVPIGINSAFRSEKVNEAVGGVKNSQHRLGFAADIVPKGINIDEAFKKIAKSKIPYDQLIIETKKNGSRWIHISFNPTGGRKELLSYNEGIGYKSITV
jgi:zinc D-Ala-D-Ala carboxypeptidase